MRAPDSDRRVDMTRRARFEMARADLVRRLARACADYRESELHELTRRMMLMQFRYETSTAVPDRSRPEPA
jgi:hypothetical protein